jgi:hypothetical protein
MPSFKNSFLLTFAFLTWMTLNIGCSASSGRSFMPHVPGYSEKQKEVIVLKKKLLEISGIFYQQDGRIASMNDEDGKLFLFHPGDDDDSIETFKFAGKGDYEDIVQINGAYFVLESDGDLHYFEKGSPASYVKYEFEIEKKTEFESLVHYPHERRLVLITKDHRLEKDAIYAYAFDLVSKRFYSTPYFIISRREIANAAKDVSAVCKPSAAAINPINNKLFIIASVGKILLQCSLDGKVEKAFLINPAQFQQPEGISFASNGDMYISNEGLHGKATLLKFPYNQALVSK